VVSGEKEKVKRQKKKRKKTDGFPLPFSFFLLPYDHSPLTE